MKPDHNDNQLYQEIIKVLGLKNECKVDYDIVKRSIDARHKPEIIYVYSVDVKSVELIQEY